MPAGRTRGLVREVQPVSWPCRTTGCVNPAESGRRKLCSACLSGAKKPRGKTKKCRMRGCPRPQFKDGLCSVCHPNKPAAEEIVVRAIADGKNPAKAIQEQTHKGPAASRTLAMETLMRADTQTRVAELIVAADFHPAQGLRTLARLLDAKKLAHPKLALLPPDQIPEHAFVEDAETQLEAVKIWRDVVGLTPAPAAGGGGKTTNVLAVHVGAVPTGGGTDQLRGAYLPPLRPKADDEEVIVVPNRSIGDEDDE